MDVDVRKANELFHDCESCRYDDKWGIMYDEENALRVKRKFEKVLGGPFPNVDKLLEVGCGTGYVGLNLCTNEGLIGRLYACDISRGMVETCRRNAKKVGVEVRAKRSELERLLYPDNEFDMVVGHAILHHIPDIGKAFSEIYRVLKPGGICMLAGEPTRAGDTLGHVARFSTGWAVKLYVRCGGYFGGQPARLRQESGNDGGDPGVKELEKVVDIHAFRPARVCRVARSVGFSEARYESEELLSSFVGWITRTIENNMLEENITFRWRYRAYSTYIKLNSIDEKIYPYLPSWWFYNMLLFLRKPE